jgi:hypothetical protein
VEGREFVATNISAVDCCGSPIAVAGGNRASIFVPRVQRRLLTFARCSICSRPAPPPSIERESLLLRLLDRRDARRQAMLNPAIQATPTAKEDEAFQNFFGPTTKRGTE